MLASSARKCRASMLPCHPVSDTAAKATVPIDRQRPTLPQVLLVAFVSVDPYSNHFASALSKYFTSSMLPGGPPAQCPHIDGKTSSFPIPGFMHFTSYSESSGLWQRSISLHALGQPTSTLTSPGLNLREIQVGFAGHDEGFRLDSAHCSFEIAIVRFLLRAVARLPRVQHDEQILGVFG
jgi:hypothetical protein